MNTSSAAAEQRRAKPAARPEGKLDTIKRMLRRRQGASIQELTSAAAWQKPSIHGQLSVLRKKGAEITREKRGDGTAAYFLKG